MPQLVQQISHHLAAGTFEQFLEAVATAFGIHGKVTAQYKLPGDGTLIKLATSSDFEDAKGFARLGPAPEALLVVVRAVGGEKRGGEPTASAASVPRQEAPRQLPTRVEPKSSGSGLAQMFKIGVVLLVLGWSLRRLR
jgi:hypothetical protein